MISALRYTRAQCRRPDWRAWSACCASLRCRSPAPSPRTRNCRRPRAPSTPPAPPAPRSTRSRTSAPRPILLARAHQSVGERDYRAALSHALESSARAQAAARAAVEGRVRARLAADQAIGEVASAIAQVRTRLDTPEARRVPATVRRSAQRAVAAADTALAAARAAVAKGRFWRDRGAVAASRSAGRRSRGADAGADTGPAARPPVTDAAQELRRRRSGRAAESPVREPADVARSSPWWKSRRAPRPTRRPIRKARQPRISGNIRGRSNAAGGDASSVECRRLPRRAASAATPRRRGSRPSR